MLYRHLLNTPYTPSVISALLTCIAFPPINLWGISFVSLIPFIWGLKRLYTLKEHLLYFFLFGTTYMGILHIWFLELHHFSNWPSVIFAVIAYSLFLGSYYLITAGLYYWSHRSLWLLPLCWIISEWIRSSSIIGNPTGVIAYSQGYNPILIQWASLLGTFGVSFIVVFLNVLLLLTLNSTIKKRHYITAVLCIICIGTFLYFKPIKTNTAYTVSIIQGNHSQQTKLHDSNWPSIIKTYVKLTEKSLQKTHSQFIIWPETITPDLNLNNPHTLNQIRYLSSRYNTHIIFGTPTYQNNKYYNSVAVMSPSGLSTSLYHKVRLMPFGEYWPGKSLLTQLGFGQLIPGAEYSSGTPTQPLLKIHQTGIGIGICLESLYPWFYNRMKHQGADFMVILANNAWFMDSSGAEKHLQMSLFRAVENNSYFLQASNTGLSAIISPKGQLLQHSKLNEQMQLTDSIFKVHKKSIYNHIGDIIIYFSIFIVLIKGAKRFHIKLS